MPPKSYQSRKNSNKSSGHEVMGVVLIIISSLILLCICIPILIGVVSQGIFNVVTGIFGVSAYPMFFCTLIWGIMLFLNRPVTLSRKSIALIAVCALSFVFILQTALTYQLLSMSISKYLDNVWNTKFTPGGVVFGVITYGLCSAIKPVGVLVLFSIVLLAGAAFLSDVYSRIRNLSSKRGVIVQQPQRPAPPRFAKSSDTSARRVMPVADNSLYVGSIQKSNKDAGIKTETGTTQKMSSKIVRPLSGFTDTPIFQSYSPVAIEDEYVQPKSNAQKVLFEDQQTLLKKSLEQYKDQSETVYKKPSAPQVAMSEPQIINTVQESAPQSSEVSRPQKPKAIIHTNPLEELAFPAPKSFEHEYVEGHIINGDDITRNIIERQKEQDKSSYVSPLTQPQSAGYKQSPQPQPVSYQQTPQQPQQRKYVFEEEFNVLSGFDTRKSSPVALTPIEDNQSAAIEDLEDEVINDAPITNGDYFAVRDTEQSFVRALKEEREKDGRTDLDKGYQNVPEDNNAENKEEPPFVDSFDDNEIIRASEFESLKLGAESVDEQPQTAYNGGEATASDTVFKINDDVLDLSEKTDIINGEDFTGQYVPVNEVKKQKSKTDIKVAPNQITIDNYMEKRAVQAVQQEQKPRRRRGKSKYIRPSIDMLLTYENRDTEYNPDYEKNSRMIEQTLENLKIPAKVTAVTRGPAVTRYEMEMPPGIPVKRVENFARDIAYNLAAKGKIRIEAPIPGKRAVGIEVPNDKIATVGLKDIISSKEFNNESSPLTLALGKDISGSSVVCCLEKMPHLLIAGSTGSGKSACLNSIIMSILYKSTPDEVRLILIDPKRVEFVIYRDMPHLLFKDIINEPEQAMNAFKWAKEEMDRRYMLFSKCCARNMADYNNSQAVKDGTEEKMYNIVIVVDELCELMLSSNKRDLEEKIMSMAQKARAAGIHLILATQRPSVDVITGTIKANLSSRIAFAVTSIADSRTILDSGGAEALLGRGDMLFAPIDASEPKRIQGAFVNNEEVAAIVGFVKDNNECDFDEDAHSAIFVKPPEPSENSSGGGVEETGFDPLVPEVLRRIMECGQATTSMIQRRFPIGYARASRIIDQLELNKFIGPLEGNNKPREVYITKEMFKDIFGEDY